MHRPAFKVLTLLALLISVSVFVWLRWKPSGPPVDSGCNYGFPSYDPKFELKDEDLNDLKPEEKSVRFELSQCYPQHLAVSDPPWVEGGRVLNFSSQSEWKDYMLAILKYSYEKNLAADWVVQKNQPVTWFHAPWLHYGGTGREPLHGLTYERVSDPGELAEKQGRSVQNWAVSVYNAPGGYVLGKVWADPSKPKPSGAEFPNGTVSVKLLFTEATADEVSYLRGQEGHEWAAYIYKQLPKDPKHPSPDDPRAVRRLRLLQIDISARDDRSPTRWVFGTFVYNGDLSQSPYDWCKPSDSPWCKVVPLGLMWGNDPTLTEAQAQTRSPVESFFNDPSALPSRLLEARKCKVGLGWQGRLNGPVDDGTSSCLSCHATASWPQFDRVPPPDLVDEKKMYWFRNYHLTKDRQPFWPGTEPLDFSLQLSAGVRNFYLCKAEKRDLFCISPAPQPQQGPARPQFNDPITRAGAE